jgi:hypothetical protein
MTKEEALALIKSVIQTQAEQYRPLGGMNYFAYTTAQIQAINQAIAVLEAD